MKYKISDEVAMRFVQIFQEALLMGVDGADLMRQVRLVADSSEDGALSLDPDYKKFVEESHQKYLKEIEEKRAASSSLDVQAEVFSKN